MMFSLLFSALKIFVSELIFFIIFGKSNLRENESEVKGQKRKVREETEEEKRKRGRNIKGRI